MRCVANPDTKEWIIKL